MNKVYKHNKTGDLYKVCDLAIDCTNSRNGSLVVIYKPLDKNPNTIYVRDEAEFNQKFTLIDT